jgi:protein-disulfide isomerase
MSESPVTRWLEILASKKGMTIAVPALLLLAGALAVGRTKTEPGVAAFSQTPIVVAQAGTTSTDAAKADASKPDASKAGGSFTPAQRRELEALIKDYLVNNPEVMMEIQTALEAKMEKVQSEKMQAAIKENAKDLFKSASAPVVGNANGDITIVEFFDYNCGYCKKAFSDVAQVVEKDKKVRVVMKEFPILSKGSEEAAKVALASRMQNKYWEVHRGLLEMQGQANEASALKVAEKAGLDMAKLKRDMASADVKKEIDDVRKLAQKMGVQGTPNFMVGDRVIAGAPENLAELLMKNVAELRQNGCSVC